MKDQVYQPPKPESLRKLGKRMKIIQVSCFEIFRITNGGHAEYFQMKFIR
jgi:hypothetical protein